MCSWNEDAAEASNADSKAERSRFQELSPTSNLLQSQNAAGQLASMPICSCLQLLPCSLVCQPLLSDAHGCQLLRCLQTKIFRWPAMTVCRCN